MWQCYYCRLPLPQEVQRKNRLCPNCGSDIHACKNCSHFDESLSSQCSEPNSPWIRDRGTQNNCTYFEFKDSATRATQEAQHGERTTEAEKAKEAFRALFRDA